jgi:hypothetical protein
MYTSAEESMYTREEREKEHNETGEKKKKENECMYV